MQETVKGPSDLEREGKWACTPHSALLCMHMGRIYMKTSFQRATVSWLFKSSSTSGLNSCSSRWRSSFKRSTIRVSIWCVRACLEVADEPSAGFNIPKKRRDDALDIPQLSSTVVYNLAYLDCVPTSDVEKAWVSFQSILMTCRTSL